MKSQQDRRMRSKVRRHVTEGLGRYEQFVERGRVSPVHTAARPVARTMTRPSSAAIGCRGWRNIRGNAGGAPADNYFAVLEQLPNAREDRKKAVMLRTINAGVPASGGYERLAGIWWSSVLHHVAYKTSGSYASYDVSAVHNISVSVSWISFRTVAVVFGNSLLTRSSIVQ
jgi:hypothetical protein